MKTHSRASLTIALVSLAVGFCSDRNSDPKHRHLRDQHNHGDIPEIFHNSTYLLESLPMMPLILSSNQHEKDSPSLTVIDERVL